MSAPEKNQSRWVLRDTEICAEKLAETLGVHPLSAEILARRGVSDIESAEQFLNPSLKSMHDPFMMKGMKRAVREILRTIDAGERIVVHGDYDVDGISSVGVLYGFLRSLGANVGYYIPKRDQDGYGLNIETVRRLHTQGTHLLITTDCGISNVDEIRFARQMGMRVIIVDHHTVPEKLPPANAILNPLQPGCRFPFKSLAAVGVTFNFVVAIRAELRDRGIFELIPEPDLRAELDLVALGTVADVVPLQDENRTFVRLGLDVLAGRRRAGVSALMDRASVEVGPVTSRTISFRLAPRLNAAGRMADASICVELLTTESYGRATQLAQRLEELNTQRQSEEKDILGKAVDIAETQVESGRNVLVVAGENWNRGVLGIVASRLMEQYHRPAILIGIQDGFGKGSARSIAGVDLISVMGEAKEYLATFGGHKSAAGLALDACNLAMFHDVVDRALTESYGDEGAPVRELSVDANVSLGHLDGTFMQELEQLAPFGAGNPEPVLVARNVRASNVRVVGRRHLRAKFKDSTGVIDGFGFNMGKFAGDLNGEVSVAFVPREIQTHAGRRFEIQIKDIRPNES